MENRIIVGQAFIVKLVENRVKKNIVAYKKKGWFNVAELTPKEQSIVFSNNFLCTINLTQEDWDYLEEKAEDGIMVGYILSYGNEKSERTFYEYSSLD